MKPDVRSSNLSGWGLATRSRATVVSGPSSVAADSVARAGNRGVIARGLGRSYGDAAQNAGGTAFILESSLSDVEVDRGTATVRAGGGVSLHDLLEILVPKGFFVPVTPGTRFVTVGGAIASDIHGKNHHLEGSFGNHVIEIDLLLADGSVRTVGPDREPDVFWATVGGMGLTGIILRARFRVLPIQTSSCLVSTRRCRDIDDLMAAMSEDDEKYRYSVAWTDLMATGANLGRSVLWRGDHARLDDLDRASRAEPLRYHPRHLVSIPPNVPNPGFVNPLTSRVFSGVWFRKAPRRRDGELKSIPAFFHPLDAVGHWNRLYGPRGFLQYQFVVPFDADDTLRRIVERLAAAQIASPLVVLKRFGPANPGPLSFPMPGWTLTVDVPAGAGGLMEVLRDLDDLVLEVGGRHYLAKDAHMTAATMRRGYPRLGEWQAVQRSLDPTGRWCSDQARRLGLVERTTEHG